MKRLGGRLTAFTLPLAVALVVGSLFTLAMHAAANHAMIAEYGLLKTGMGREEADRVMRFTGVEISSTEAGGHVTRLVEWNGPDGAAITATFSDGRLIGKSREPAPGKPAGEAP